MTDSWRDEPLTKGEMYDALTAAASLVEVVALGVEKHASKFSPAFTIRLLGYSRAVVVDALKQTAHNLKGPA